MHIGLFASFLSVLLESISTLGEFYHSRLNCIGIQIAIKVPQVHVEVTSITDDIKLQRLRDCFNCLTHLFWKKLRDYNNHLLLGG